MNWQSKGGVTGLIVCGLLVAACGSSGDGTTAVQSTVAAPPTLTDKVLQPPKQKNEGRPDVVFDACTYVSDDRIREAGFDPASRKRADYPGEYTFLDCAYKSETRLLTISSGNISMEEERARFAGMIENLAVNGRDAIIVRSPAESIDECALNMRTSQGYVRVSTLLKPSILGKVDRCDRIVDIAKVIEPSIENGVA